MFKAFKKNIYVFYILIHLALGYVVHLFPFITKIISPLVVIFGVLIILKNKDRNNEALFLAAYICGIEVFLRMTGGAFFNEYGKYTIALFCLAGSIFHPVRSDKFIFVFLFLLLVPSLFIGLTESSFETDLRKTIMFNMSGELCLLACCFYTINRQITYTQFLNLIYVIALPVVSMLVYVSFFTIGIQDVFKSTGSNFATSGGFGPNQVSTILGLAAFCFFCLLLLKQSTFLEKGVYFALFVFASYRGLITFSRGGMITAAVMIIIFIAILYFYTKKAARIKILIFSFTSLIGFFVFWAITVAATDGLIAKRYNNQDALGREKKLALSGRETIMEAEWRMFLDNPIFGVGVGRNKELRLEDIGLEIANHNEITRLLAEHGSLGIIYLLILIAIPLGLWVNNKQHLLLLSFFMFWALTINHAAMRLAAPSFIYSLCLLKISYNLSNNRNEENSLHRESITESK